jgi:phage shock protein C
MPSPRPSSVIDPPRADPGPDTPTSGHKRLTRSRDSKVISGVAGGVGHYFGIDPVIVRVALVVLVLTTSGIFLLLYAAAVFIIPKEPKRASITQDAEVDESKQVSRSSLGAAVLIAVGLLALSDQIGLNLDGDFLWPLAFIGFGVAVLWSRRPPSESSPTLASNTGPYDPTDESHPFRTLVDSPIVQRAYDRVTDTFNSANPANSSAIKPKRKFTSRSRYSTIATAGFFVAVGVSWLYWRLGSLHPSPRPALAGALTIIGVLLVIGGWLGRPKLVAIGVVLTLFLGLTSAAGVRLNGGVGEATMLLDASGRPVKTVDPELLAPNNYLTQREHLDVGALAIDMRAVGANPKRGTKENPIVVDLGIGMVTVAVLPEVDLVIDAKLGGGMLNVDGKAIVSGVDQSATKKIPATKPVIEGKRKTIFVRARTGLGAIRVVHLPRGVKFESSEVDKYMGGSGSDFNFEVSP